MLEKGPELTSAVAGAMITTKTAFSKALANHQGVVICARLSARFASPAVAANPPK